MAGVNLNDPRNAEARGWGPGYPHCKTDKWVPLELDSLNGGRVRFPNHTVKDGRYTENLGLPGGVRAEIHDLVVLLLHESERRGWINLREGWCWGAACRCIKTSSGGLTNIPSNHSWALAVDLNAPENPFGGTQHEIPAAMAKLWNAYGFRWGGDYSSTKDWMHFEFMGTREDARRLTAKARKELGDVSLSKEEQEAVDFTVGEIMFLDGKPEPKNKGAHRRGWRYAAGEADEDSPTPAAPGP